VVSSERSSGLRPSASTNAITAPANPRNTEAVARTPACPRVMRVPARRIARNPANGASRQSQPPKTISAPSSDATAFLAREEQARLGRREPRYQQVSGRPRTTHGAAHRVPGTWRALLDGALAAELREG